MKKLFCFLFCFLFPIIVQAYYPSDFAEIDGEKIWMGWTEFESGSIENNHTGYGAIEKSSQVSYGRYQFHIGFSDLTIFMQRMLEIDSDIYGGFSSFVQYSAPDGKGGNPYFSAHKKELVALWKEYSMNGDERFRTTQDEVSYELYYVPTKEVLRQKGILLENFGPALRGTVWSVAIRDGRLYPNALNSQTYRALVSTYHEGISEKEYIENIMNSQASYHSGDGSRWSVSQKNASFAVINSDGTSSSNSSVGGVLGGSLDDPYPNIFGVTHLKSDKGFTCSTFLVNQYGELNDIGQFLNDIFFFLKILAPVFVLIFTTIDFLRSLTSNDADYFKKMRQRTFKRLCIGLIIFFLPFLLDILFEMFGLYDISNCGIA